MSHEDPEDLDEMARELRMVAYLVITAMTVGTGAIAFVLYRLLVAAGM